MIIFGSRANHLGDFNVNDTICDYCGNEGTQKVSVFGKYGHVFWVPFFPIGKKALAECTHCKRTIEQKDFNRDLHDVYQDIKLDAKRPFWHWSGLGILGVLIVLFSIIGETAEVDPRTELLQSDISTMITSPTMESDSISFKLKQVFDNLINEEVGPAEFKYLSKINEQEHKALILVKIPNLKDIEKETRNEVIELIEMIMEEQEGLKNYDQYIGVHGKYNLMMLKTPTAQDNGRIIITKPILDFYDN